MTYFDNHCLQYSVTLCNIDQFGSNHLHRLARGLHSYILRTGTGRTDGRNVYGVTVRVPMTLSLVKGRNYEAVCRQNAVPTPGPGGVLAHHLQLQMIKVG